MDAGLKFRSKLSKHFIMKSHSETLRSWFTINLSAKNSMHNSVFNTNHLEITNCLRLSNFLFFVENGLLSFGEIR